MNRQFGTLLQSVSIGMDFLQKSCSDALHNENKHFQFVNRWGFPVFQCYEHETKNKHRPMVLWYDYELKELKKDPQPLSLTRYDGRVHWQR